MKKENVDYVNGIEALEKSEVTKKNPEFRKPIEQLKKMVDEKFGKDTPSNPTSNTEIRK